MQWTDRTLHVIKQTLYRLRLLFCPPLKAVAIEINSFCNRKCPHCPHFDHIRPVEFLADEVVYGIIDELRRHKFEGNITYNLFSEPLLDKRLPKFVQYTREALPCALIYLNTNGDLLNLELWNILRKAGLEYAIVGQYDGQINNNISELLSELSDVEKKRLSVRLFDIHTKYVNNRAGLVKTDKQVTLPLKAFCMRPFYQLCVNYKGNIVLCCMDYLGLVEVADVRKQKLFRVWRWNLKFLYYRIKLVFKSRSHLTLCETCDYAQQNLKSVPSRKMIAKEGE